MDCEKYKNAHEASRIYLLPNLFTAGNMFCGFLAIIFCIQAKYLAADDAQSATLYTQAVAAILGAFLCDGLDGRVARISKRESLFGLEFDSIADTVSFGVAPAMMVFFLILQPKEGFEFFTRIGWLIGFIYLLCVGVRLARFNVLTHPLLPKEPAKTKDFMGLPSPAGAGMIASLVLVLIDKDLRFLTVLLPFFMLLIAVLMVSNIPYPSFKHINWNTRARARTFILIIISAVLIVVFHKYSFALLFLGYIFFGPLRYLYRKLRHKNAAAFPDMDPEDTF